MVVNESSTVSGTESVPATEPASRPISDRGARARKAKFRRRLLERLWTPRGIRSCPGPDGCPWCLPGEDCGCRSDLPCSCERKLYEGLVEEGRRPFGLIIGGMVARLLLDSAKLAAAGDPKSVEVRARLVDILLRDARGREDLAQRERRLAAEESRKPRSIMDLFRDPPPRPALASGAPSPAPGPSASPLAAGGRP